MLSRACSHYCKERGNLIYWRHGNHEGTIWQDLTILATPARECEHEQSATGKRDTVCHGKRVQMEGIAGKVRELAYSIHADEPLEQEWSIEASV